MLDYNRHFRGVIGLGGLLVCLASGTVHQRVRQGNAFRIAFDLVRLSRLGLLRLLAILGLRLAFGVLRRLQLGKGKGAARHANRTGGQGKQNGQQGGRAQKALAQARHDRPRLYCITRCGENSP
ncbi:hypothetical protein D3C72_740250 [compost metagenome]